MKRFFGSYGCAMNAVSRIHQQRRWAKSLRVCRIAPLRVLHGEAFTAHPRAETYKRVHNKRVRQLHACMDRNIRDCANTRMRALTGTQREHNCMRAWMCEAGLFPRMHACRYVVRTILPSPLFISQISSLRLLPRGQATAGPAHQLYWSEHVCATAALRTPLPPVGGEQSGTREARVPRWLLPARCPIDVGIWRMRQTGTSHSATPFSSAAILTHTWHAHLTGCTRGYCHPTWCARISLPLFLPAS